MAVDKEMKSFKKYITEVVATQYGHTLWIDPKGKVYDMGNSYTHHEWASKNWKKFSKTEPSHEDMWDLPYEQNWIRVKVGRSVIDIEAAPKKINRKQKSTIEDIYYSQNNTKMKVYIDAWEKNKTSRGSDKMYKGSDEADRFFRENRITESVVEKLKKNKKVIDTVKKHANENIYALISALMSIPVVSKIIQTSPDKLNSAQILASSLKRMVLSEAKSGSEQKGWIHKTGKTMISRGAKPYHVQILISNLSKFGVKESEVKKILFHRFDEWDSPDPEKDVNDYIKELETGKKDTDSVVDFLAIKKDWCRVVLDDYSSIEGKDLKTIYSVAKVIDKKYPNVIQGMLSFELIVVKPDGRKKEYVIEDPWHWAQWIKKGGDPAKAEQGRTDIGKTMAMFR